MTSEPDFNGSENARAIASEGVLLDAASLKAIRHDLHELANVLTGVLIAGGLLSQLLKGSNKQYAQNICESGERGSALVRQIRSELLSACGEAQEAGTTYRQTEEGRTEAK